MPRVSLTVVAKGRQSGPPPLAIAASAVMVPSEPVCGFCQAISAPGTLYAAIASNARARDVLLPLLLFPVLIPALLGAVKATGLVIEGDPMFQLLWEITGGHARFDERDAWWADHQA